MKHTWQALSRAPFVFFALTALILWATGNLRLGAAQEASSIAAAQLHLPGDGHDHGAKATNEAEDWCAEHGVAESACTRCNPEFVAAFKARGDWCEGHGMPESQCVLCNPPGSTASPDGLEALAQLRCEHEVRTIDCDECRFELGVVKVESSLARSLITTAEVHEQELVTRLRLTGEVQPDATRVVDVPPAASGRIVSVETALGKTVERGDVLAVLRSDAFGAAKAAYLDARVTLDVARKERDRRAAINTALERLLERLEGNGAEPTEARGGAPVGPWKSKLLGAAARVRRARSAHAREQELQQKRASSVAELETARQEFDAARAEYGALIEEITLDLDLERMRADGAFDQAEAALQVNAHRLRIFGMDAAEVTALARSTEGSDDFARLEIRAPRSGTVIAQDVSVGRYVTGADGSLFTIADLSNLWVWCDLYDSDLAPLAEHLESEERVSATVQVAAYGSREFAGTLDLIGTLVDPRTRTLKVRVQVPNATGLLRPGMFARVHLAIPLDKRATTVPRDAVLSDDGQAFVFRHWTGDLWLRRDVKLAATQGALVAIEGDVPVGATVAVGGAFMLKSDVLRAKMGAG